jgi:MinD superfamily P-loop ATPase
MIISIASGKGGTGKTLVATSLALSLKKSETVQIIDCDVEEPNDHILLKPVITGSESVTIKVPVISKEKCNYCGVCAKTCVFHAIAVLGENVLTFPSLCHGCGACSYLCPQKAISEEDREIGVVEWGQSDGLNFVQGKLTVGEAMAPPVIRKAKEHAEDEGIVIVDVPPGTSCPVVEAVKDSDYCLLVTEPTPFGLNDLALAVETVRALKIPCGVVLNRAGVGDNKVEEYCTKEHIPILLTIPLDMEIARLYSRGIPLIEGIPVWKDRFVELFEKIKETVNERTIDIKR